jgi:septal ring factor EnvC (AmiA/AmiB activator)
MSKRAKKDDGLGGGGSQKKKKAAENTGKAKCEEEDVEEEEHRKMTPSEQKMAGLDKQIKELTAEIEGYKTERNQCADEKRRDKLADLITARGNNLTELLRQQNAQGSFLFFSSFLKNCLFIDPY